MGHLAVRRIGVVAALAAMLAPSTAPAQSIEPVKPYIVFILDVSGSMTTATEFGPPSCPGSDDTRMDHAKCAIQNIAASYGEMVMALGRFRQTSTDTNCGDGCTIAGYDCDPDNDGVGCTQDTAQGTGCTAAMENGDRFELLVPLVDGNQASLIDWNDFTCTTCTKAGDPEIIATGWTPLAGSLRGSRLYWQGQPSPTQGAYWVGPGEDPIVDDPFNKVFPAGPTGGQCRPYITVLLTDGDETCASSFADTTGAATALYTTPVTLPGEATARSYRILTKPIGFGKAPGDAEIEAIAIAGQGGVDNPGNDGAYAQNEEELQLEIAQIIADALKYEACNGLDDDCDTRIDEDFAPPYGPLGEACDDGEEGVCRGTGVYVCAGDSGVECGITDPGGVPTAETCDGEDDDCDGSVDEGACGGCQPTELCNSLDDDCDGRTDEGLVRTCGVDLGVCDPGTETCTGGAWVGCTADPLPGELAETCDGLDNDCDGTVDGVAVECTTLPGNTGLGQCRPGTAFCPTDGTGTLGPCVGEIGPSTESCDLVDNDCDGTVDEDTGGADCSTSCGVGQTVCVMGELQCDAVPAPDDDTCNNVDDDCDGRIDENVGPGAACSDGGAICNGVEQCLLGEWVCVGEGIEPELCNCEDDDCDAQIDDDDPCNTGVTGATCVDPAAPGFACQCAQPCAGGEFPCAIGRVCVEGYCLVDPCAGVTCGPDAMGNAQVCDGGVCEPACADRACPSPLICYGPTGECRPDDCTTFPEYCGAGEACVGGACVSDPCAQVSCPGAGEYCVGGDCVRSCAGVACAAGERCRLGACEADPCGGACPGGDVCDEDTATCVDDPCDGRSCPAGQWCDPQTGDCAQDPCATVTCPGEGEVCVGGTCYAPETFVDAGVDADEDYVSAAGGGGCAAGGAAGGGALGALLALGLAVLPRRRRRAGRAGGAS